MERMMSIGSVASVAVMVRFILRDMLIEPQMVTIVGGSTSVDYVVGLDLWGIFEM